MCENERCHLGKYSEMTESEIGGKGKHLKYKLVIALFFYIPVEQEYKKQGVAWHRRRHSKGMCLQQAKCAGVCTRALLANLQSNNK